MKEIRVVEGVLTRPAVFPVSVRMMRIPALGLAMNRRHLSFAFIGIAAVAALTYVFSVNFILVSGKAAREAEAKAILLERDVALLQSRFAEKSSPVAVKTHSQAIGMVDAADVRYLVHDRAVALSKKPLQ